ncbi:hypothetical protein VTI74DRAFT_3370 [Chaetomium olivicolor]
MGYFDEYDLDSRFKSTRTSWNPVHGHYHVVMDWDQRRINSVCTSEEKDEEFVYEALYELIDDIPADVVRIEVSNDFELLSSSTAPDDDSAIIPFYPEPTDFPEYLPKIRRSQLTEIERLGVQADHTIYEPTPGEIRHVVFKYYMNEGNIAMFWHETNCTLRIPKHPNIVPFDSLVVDSAGPGCPDKAVGFTAPFIPGGTAIDYLNLRLGIVHGDICMWNLLIDPETDDLKVFDFNLGAKLGWEGDKENRGVFGYKEARNDVNIARDLSFREENYLEDLDASMVLQKQDWEQHPDVRLEEGVKASEYRPVLEDWVNARKTIDAELKNYKQAPDSIDWPPLPQFPLVDCGGAMMRRGSQMRQRLIRRGEPFIKWPGGPRTTKGTNQGKKGATTRLGCNVRITSWQKRADRWERLVSEVSQIGSTALTSEPSLSVDELLQRLTLPLFLSLSRNSASCVPVKARPR